MERKSCKDCIYRTKKNGELFCPRHNHWLQPDTMQISPQPFVNALCDFQPIVNNEKPKPKENRENGKD